MQPPLAHPWWTRCPDQPRRAPGRREIRAVAARRSGPRISQHRPEHAQQHRVQRPGSGDRPDLRIGGLEQRQPPRHVGELLVDQVGPVQAFRIRPREHDRDHRPLCQLFTRPQPSEGRDRLGRRIAFALTRNRTRTRRRRRRHIRRRDQGSRNNNRIRTGTGRQQPSSHCSPTQDPSPPHGHTPDRP